MNNNISNEKLSKMIDDILNKNSINKEIDNTGYVDEKAEAFINSLKDMVN